MDLTGTVENPSEFNGDCADDCADQENHTCDANATPTSTTEPFRKKSAGLAKSVRSRGSTSRHDRATAWHN